MVTSSIVRRVRLLKGQKAEKKPVGDRSRDYVGASSQRALSDLGKILVEAPMNGFGSSQI